MGFNGRWLCFDLLVGEGQQKNSLIDIYRKKGVERTEWIKWNEMRFKILMILKYERNNSPM